MSFLVVGIANAVLTFIIFAFTLPGLATSSRGWLKVAGYLVVLNALFTLGIGINLWTTTLKMRERFDIIWVAQSAEVQSLMQTAVSLASSALTNRGPHLHGNRRLIITYHVISSLAVVSQTAHHLRSSQT